MLFASYDIRSASDRVRLPREVVRGLGEHLVMTRGLNSSVDLYSVATWEKLVTTMGHRFPILSPEGRRIQRFLFSGAAEAKVQTSQRVIVPAALQYHANLVPPASDTKERTAQDLTLLCVGSIGHLLQRAEWHRLREAADAGDVISRLTPSVFRDEGVDDESAEQAGVVADAVASAAGRTKGRNVRADRRLEFEVAEALDTPGLGLVELTRPSQDSGIDVMVHLPSQDSARVLYVQCKSGGGKVTVKDVRELIGVVARDGSKAGLLVSTAGFTRDAREEARVSKVVIELVEARRLATWIEEEFPFLRALPE